MFILHRDSWMHSEVLLSRATLRRVQSQHHFTYSPGRAWVQFDTKISWEVYHIFLAFSIVFLQTSHRTEQANRTYHGWSTCKCVLSFQLLRKISNNQVSAILNHCWFSQNHPHHRSLSVHLVSFYLSVVLKFHQPYQQRNIECYWWHQGT